MSKGITVVLCGTYVQFVNWCYQKGSSPEEARRNYIVPVYGVDSAHRLMGCYVSEIIRVGTHYDLSTETVVIVESRHARWKAHREV